MPRPHRRQSHLPAGQSGFVAALAAFLTLLPVLLLSPAAMSATEIPRKKPDSLSAPAAQPQDTESLIGGDADAETFPVTDLDEETYSLPPYPAGARVSMGSMQTYVVKEEDTFLDIARHFGLGYVELRAANPGVDPWAPTPGERIVIPGFSLLPRARQEGIVVNLGEMRMYYFKDKDAPPLTYALGIGREGLATPTGETVIVRKAAAPSWYPTPRMREEKPWLPAAVPPGPSNPLGTHALYLGWPTFLIHGSNKPWGIGRRVSSGCLRMYPENIEALFKDVPAGTRVTVVDQPILVSWIDDILYLEANPSKTQSTEIEMTGVPTAKPVTKALRQMIVDAAGGESAAAYIDWDTADRALRERRGYPIIIGRRGEALKADAPEKPQKPQKPKVYVPSKYN